MGIRRHKPEEIVTKLRQVEVLVGQGRSRIDAIREVQITEQTFYRWRKQYGGMGTVRLELDNWTGHKFTDLFTLLKVDGTWKIMNKVFYLHP